MEIDVCDIDVTARDGHIMHFDLFTAETVARLAIRYTVRFFTARAAKKLSEFDSRRGGWN